MNIETLILKDTNCYLVSTEKAAIVIDPGYKDERTEKFLKENSHKERMILITHAHFDHIGGANSLRKECSVKIAIGKKDNPALSDNVLNEGINFGYDIEPFSADLLLCDGQKLKIGDLEIEVFELEGHTAGGVAYYINGTLFTGDILFYRGFGNTCFHGGSRAGIIRSINRLFKEFPLSTPVLSGHGIATTIGDEKSYYGR